MSDLQYQNITNIMTTDVLVVGPHEAVKEVVLKMSGKNVGSAIVGVEGTVLGIFTERDLLHNPGIGNSKKSIAHMMTKNIVTISHLENLDRARDIMEEKHIRHLPVTKDNIMIGILSARDILNAFHSRDTIKIKQLEAVQSVIVTYSHEINNPLSVLVMAMKGLLRESQLRDCDNTEKLDQAMACVDRISDVIKKISEIDQYEEVQYSKGQNMLKIDVKKKKAA